MRSRSDGRSWMTRILRLVWHRSEPDPEFDESLDRALSGVDATYVALDVDVLDPSEIDVLIPEPDGPSAEEVERLLRNVADRTTIAGMGVTGMLATERDAALAARMLAAAGF